MNVIAPEKVSDDQYKLIAEIRLAQDGMIWQTPVLSLTGQAFLFTIAFGSGTVVGRLIASILILITSFASVQLLAKHRHLEVYCSRLLEKIEREKGWEAIHQQAPEGKGFVRWSSYRIWMAVLLAFGVAAIAAAVTAIWLN